MLRFLIFFLLSTSMGSTLVFRKGAGMRISIKVPCRCNALLTSIASFRRDLRIAWNNYPMLSAQFGRDEIERCNSYVDKILQDVMTENIHEFDPYVMDDSRVGFNKKVVFFNVSGEAKLFNGYITGLRTLHRPSDCTLTEKGGRLYIEAGIGGGVLNLHYDGTVRFMNLGPTITVHGTIHYVEIIMGFSVDSKTGKDGKLHKFIIDDLRGMKVWITGLGPLNWAVNPILSGVTKIFQKYVRKALQNKVESHIRERLPKYQFPVEGIVITEATSESVTVEKIRVTEELVTEETGLTTEEEPVTEDTGLTTEEVSVTEETGLTTEEELVTEDIKSTNKDPFFTDFFYIVTDITNLD